LYNIWRTLYIWLLSVCTVSNCHLSLYFNICRLREGAGKVLMALESPRKVLEFFVSQGVGTLFYLSPWHSVSWLFTPWGQLWPALVWFLRLHRMWLSAVQLIILVTFCSVWTLFRLSLSVQFWCFSIESCTLQLLAAELVIVCMQTLIIGSLTMEKDNFLGHMCKTFHGFD